MDNPFNFANQRVLVVGGTSGINQGVALAFARAGASVAVASRSQEKVDATQTLLAQAGAADVFGFVCDVRDSAAVTTGMDALQQRWGHLDVLISGAAGNFPALATGMSANAFRSVVEIDLLGSFHVLQAAYPLLKKPGASVIQISAPQAQVALVAQSHVCAAKAGVDMLTRTLAQEWGPDGIRVNSVMPGPIDGTEGMRRLAPTEAIRTAVCKSVPLQRMGAPEDVANACLFLSSPLASYITGVVLPVDGGWVLGGVAGMGAGLAAVARTQVRI
jgi:NAD(P)-dependent dehydrogenase (short-subunit alcohol dehydrogenase family)